MASTRYHSHQLLVPIALAALAAGCGTSRGAGPSEETASEALAIATPTFAAEDCVGHDDEDDSATLREFARRPVSFHGKRRPEGRQVPVKILGFNDFHGQISPKNVSEGGRWGARAS